MLCPPFPTVLSSLLPVPSPVLLCSDLWVCPHLSNQTAAADMETQEEEEQSQDPDIRQAQPIK
jgi:hypothetical protein